jgi:SAM-dependent methyltransferase
MSMDIFRRWSSLTRRRGLKWLFRFIMDFVFNRKIKNIFLYSKYFINKTGIEIGGPSRIFKANGEIPLYKLIKNIDNVNFSSKPFLFDKLKKDSRYYVDREIRRQYVKDTVDLKGISSDKYDFVLASHVLEHIANPIKAISEWRRILKKNGILLVILPEKRNSFDYFREYTSFEHLISDFNKNVKEDDQTHAQEIFKFHDLDMGDIHSKKNLKKLMLNVFENRAIHHHVFSMDVLIKIFVNQGFRIIDKQYIWPFTNLVLCKKIEHTNLNII